MFPNYATHIRNKINNRSLAFEINFKYFSTFELSEIPISIWFSTLFLISIFSLLQLTYFICVVLSNILITLQYVWYNLRFISFHLVVEKSIIQWSKTKRIFTDIVDTCITRSTRSLPYLFWHCTAVQSMG